MIDYLDSIDKSLLLWLNGHHTEFLDNFMYLASDKWVWVPVYVTIFAALCVRYGMTRKLLAAVAVFALTISITDGIVADVIRPLICRPRPSNVESGISTLVHIVNGYRGGHYGFPSCHGANSFALAMLIALVMRSRRLTLFIYTWAVFHSYSRIYLGVHYPGDILSGAVVGTLVALALYWVADRAVGLRRPEDRRLSNVLILLGCGIFASLALLSLTPVYRSVFALIV